jgi:hypothetical protein
MPQPPQLFGSVVGSTQAPPQHSEAPSESVHAVPSATPAHALCAQNEPVTHVDPAGHAVGPAVVVHCIVQLPMVHSEVPGQTWPQPPQLFLSIAYGFTQPPEQHTPDEPSLRLHVEPWGAEEQLGTGHVKLPMRLKKSTHVPHIVQTPGVPSDRAQPEPAAAPPEQPGTGEPLPEPEELPLPLDPEPEPDPELAPEPEEEPAPLELVDGEPELEPEPLPDPELPPASDAPTCAWPPQPAARSAASTRVHARKQRWVDHVMTRGCARTMPPHTGAVCARARPFALRALFKSRTAVVNLRPERAASPQKKAELPRTHPRRSRTAFWIVPSPTPSAFFATRDEAFRHAARTLQAAGLPLPQRLLDIQESS